MTRSILKRIAKVVTLALLVSLLLPPRAFPADSLQPLPPWDWEFIEAAPQGFGDRQNNGAWAMEWWNGNLYVGTGRALQCWSQACLRNETVPLIPYPPDDLDMSCTPDPLDLPLQAEIWRYTPTTDTWLRVYQAPKDLEVPGQPGRYIGRDMGYRGMTVFTESDGTEALYVSALIANCLQPMMPPPRILRSTDGLTFEPLPQAPGTTLGDLGDHQGSFRTQKVYKDRFYVINGSVHGKGGVLESANPALGNDSFRWITPQGMEVFEIEVYNGFLYLGVADTRGLTGYRVVKTDATGPVPYHFETIIDKGGYLAPLPSDGVVSLEVFNDRLYVGTDKPAELVRVNPDDSWDLIMGTARNTPEGWKFPLSGFDAGFDWQYNVHVWRQQAHDGALYMATADQTTRFSKMFPTMADEWAWQMGFDVYFTQDGRYFSPITVTGFGDKFQSGGRNFASTPYGLFLGTMSLWYGLRVFQQVPRTVHAGYLPLLVKDSPSSSAMDSVSSSGGGFVIRSPSQVTRRLDPPQRLEAEATHGAIVLSWERPSQATRYRIFRSDSVSNREMRAPDLAPDTWIPKPFVEVGATDQFYFLDTTVQTDQPYRYYVMAEDDAGLLSPPSNLARAPSLAPPATFASVEAELADWSGAQSKVDSQMAAKDFALTMADARAEIRTGNIGRAERQLEQLRQGVKHSRAAMQKPWQAEDLDLTLSQLIRRVRLAQLGILTRVDVSGSK